MVVSTKERYAPTVEELKVIRAANRTFLGTYLFGIATGIVGGFSLSRGFTQYRTWVLFGTSLLGEYGGRKLGEDRAHQLLDKNLPLDSHLREIMAKRDGTPMKAVFEHGLEGTAVPGYNRGASTTTAATTAQSTPAADQPSAWESIRKANTDNASAWARVRQGKSAVESEEPSSNTQNGWDDQQTSSSSQQQQQQQESPVSLRPRTREEMEELARSGRLRTNRYGDLVE
ncbi:hypothetical protein HDU77_004732 [Chytriomyces hyalinus]|nr:hypothetical protein HDU77_004732 [Chytriomyces hyalinus]